MRQRLAELVERAIRVLLAEPIDRAEARAIGSTLAGLRYARPEALGGTLEILGEELISRLPSDQAAALQPGLAVLLGQIAIGFTTRARDTVLSEQEAIRSALLTAHQDAEAALWASQARFRAIFDAAAVGIGLADMEGRIFETNRALQDMLGYSADEMRRMNVLDFTHPDDQLVDWDRYRELMAGQRDYYDYEKRYYRKDGRLVWCRVTASLVRDTEGRPRFSIAMMEDITERKAAQETIRQMNAELELRVAERTVQLAAATQELAAEIPRRRRAESERIRLLAVEQAARREAEGGRQRLAFLAEASRVLASSLDYETTLQRVAYLAVPTLADWCFVDVAEEDGSVRRLAVAHANSSMADLARELETRFSARRDAAHGPPMVLRTGQPELIAEVSGRLELLLPAFADAADARHLEFLRQIGPKSYMVVPLIARSRTIGAITFLSAESGRNYGPADLALADDLARRAAIAVDNARLYQEAQEALAVREEFLSIAAHELKTPITGLRLAAQAFLRHAARGVPVDARQLQQTIQTVDQQSLKLTRMVVQLLEISRIQLGRFILDRSKENLTPLVAGAIEQARARTTQHVLELSAPEEAWAFVDAIRFEQVITNLLDNAIKYSPNGGQIDVGIERSSPESISLTVRDYGLGIPPGHREHIFELFYQAHTESHQSGMGVGLYITRQIVELHGGRISVEFPSGGGTRFRVELPISPEPPPASSQSTLENANDEGNRAR